MSTLKKYEIPVLFAAFALSYYLYHNAKHLSLPLVLAGSVLVIAVLIKISKS